MEKQIEKMVRFSEDYGFEASVIQREQLVFVKEYRKFCEQNLCGNYQNNYGCPPYCGTPQEMEDRTKPYEQVLVLKTYRKVENAMDPSLIKVLKRIHNQDSLKLMREIVTRFSLKESLMILAGPCSLCKTCGMPKGEPCPMEKQRFSCLSAYCIDAGALSREAGWQISWDLDQVSFFSLLLF